MADAGLSLIYSEKPWVHWLVQDGELGQLERLLAAGADPNVRDREGRPALHAAAGLDTPRGSEGERVLAADAARVLLRHGADVHLRSETWGLTPLDVAASRPGSRALCALLIEAGADVNARTGAGQRTPLFGAASTGDVELLDALLAAGADPNAASVGMNRITPLVIAIRRRPVEIEPVRRLIEGGAKVEPPDRLWGVAFQHAAPHPELVRLLTHLGEDLAAPDESGRRPLTQILEYGVPESLEVLLDAGVALDRPPNGPRTAFRAAVRGGDVPMVEAVVRALDEPPGPDEMRRALGVAVDRGHVDLAGWLVESGVPVACDDLKPRLRQSWGPERRAEMSALLAPHCP